MKYTKDERLSIGKKIYTGELTLAAAALEYDINMYTARDYMRMYKATVNGDRPEHVDKKCRENKGKDSPGKDKYRKMTKGELIDRLIELEKQVGKG